MLSKQKRMAFLIVLVVLVASLFGCATQRHAHPGQPRADHRSSPATVASEPKIVTVAMTSAWDSMMPLNTNSNYSVFVYDQIYDRLIQGNAKGDYDPRLASSWEVNAVRRSSLPFESKGDLARRQPVTADDVVFTFQMYSNPEVSALSRYYLIRDRRYG